MPSVAFPTFVKRSTPRQARAAGASSLPIEDIGASRQASEREPARAVHVLLGLVGGSVHATQFLFGVHEPVGLSGPAGSLSRSGFCAASLILRAAGMPPRTTVFALPFATAAALRAVVIQPERT